VSSTPSIDPRPDAVRVELARIERRWRQLPLDRAVEGMPRLRHTLNALTDAAGQPPVPDLGPGPALHQLAVLVWEACRAEEEATPEVCAAPEVCAVAEGARTEGAATETGSTAEGDASSKRRAAGIPELLAALRRDLP